MRVAIIGSQDLTVSDLGAYLPEDTTEIVSGGGWGINTCAKEYAQTSGIKLTEFLPEYERCSRDAPFNRDRRLIDDADMVIVFWDGVSQGTKCVIDQCFHDHKKLIVYVAEKEEWQLLALN